MKFIEISQATESLAEYARGLAEESIVVTVNGQPIAALVPCNELDLECAALAKNPEFAALLERSRTRHEAEGGFSPDEIRRELGLDP